jgi:hypothetical protein
MQTVYCKLAKNQHVSETRSVALEDFAAGLASGQVRVRVRLLIVPNLDPNPNPNPDPNPKSLSP